MPRPRVSILTLGCRVNQYESDAMRGRLSTDYTIADADAPETDVILLNACTVTALAEKKARQTARRARRAHPDAVIVLVGCLADAVAQGLTRFAEADVLAGNAWKGRIEEAVAAALDGGRGLLPTIGPGSLSRERADGPSGRVRAFLKIQDGCSRACTYCRTTQVRGDPRSKPLNDIVREAADLVVGGYPEIVLTGINLAEYAAGDASLADAVRAVFGVDDLKRLRLASIDPSGVTEDLLDAIASDPRACRHLHVPLQSGDDGVLRRMARGYSAAEYLAAIDRARDRLPDATFGADVIVGFPGEDDDAFAATCGVVDRVGYVNLHVFRYSVRPGTPAARLDDDVPGDVKHRRSDAVIARWRDGLRKLLDKRIGSIQHVLVEERRGAVWQGYSDDYVPIRFASSAALTIGSIVPVRIAHAGEQHLEGVHDDRADAG